MAVVGGAGGCSPERRLSLIVGAAVTSPHSTAGRVPITARPGYAQTWSPQPYALVDGEVDPPTAAFVKFIDAANGLAVRV